MTSFAVMAATAADNAPVSNQTVAKASAPKSNAQTKESWDWGNFKGQAGASSTKAAENSGQKASKDAPGSAAANKAMNKTDKPSPKAPVKAPAAGSGGQQSAESRTDPDGRQQMHKRRP